MPRDSFYLYKKLYLRTSVAVYDSIPLLLIKLATDVRGNAAKAKHGPGPGASATRWRT